MKHTSLFLLGTASCLLLLNGCATQQKSDELEAKLQQQDAQIRQMQPAQAESYSQVQSMREEINELKGQIVDLRNAGGARFIVERLDKHEQALHQIETSMAMNFNLGTSAAAGAASAASASALAPKSAADGGPLVSDASFSAQGNPANNAQATVADGAVVAPHESTWGQETPKPEAPKAEKDMKVALYDSGMNSFNARQYEDAQRSFSDYVKNFGGTPKAADAQYYLAECYFQRNQFPDAALAYDTVITKFPNSAKAPAAYLKQGICFKKLGQGKAANARLSELIKKFPNSSEAKRAKSFMANNK